MISQLDRLKILYGDKFDENDLITVYDINGNPFQMIGCKIENITVYDAGYIITRDGKCVRVIDGQDHDSVFSLYINNYLGKSNSFEEYESGKCSKILNDTGHIVYFGVKMEYLTAINNPNHSYENYLKDENISKMARGIGVLSFPKNEDITNEQRLACSNMLFTNLKEQGNTYKKSLDITYGNIETGRVYDSIELNILLTMDLVDGIKFDHETLIYFVNQYNKYILIEQQRLNNILREYEEETTNNSNMRAKMILKAQYDKINNDSSLSFKEKSINFNSIFEVATQYDDDTIIDYITGKTQGKPEKLKRSIEKINVKLERYNLWIDYITSKILIDDDKPKVKQKN